MTTIIRNKDVVISNPQLKPIYTPFTAESGLLAAWRFGDGVSDLSNNGNTLSAIGSPGEGDYFITGDKNNGFLTSVPDGLERTIVAVWRNHSDTDAYGYPVGNLAQLNSSTGIGLGLTSNSSSSANLSRVSGSAGGVSKTGNLFAYAGGPSDSYASRNAFRWAALTVSGSANNANLYLPKSNPALIPATIASGANLATRDITEGGGPSFYRLITYRDPSLPVTLPGTSIDVAEVLIFDRALNFAELQRTYSRSQIYLASFGQNI